ncbi:DUF6252 family protein [Flavobacterium sp.]|jgi:hypothetical protein|uniref:DUF6252 family protein n=1 Tax=Flavobacterium sp. TaxID=239 RepID=UPI0037C01D02
MKKNKIFSIFTFLFIAFSFISCDNEPIDPTLLAQIAANSSSNGNNSSTGSFTANIDGVNFTAESVAASMLNVPTNGNILSIVGVKSSGEYIAIQITNPTIGTFVANNNSNPLQAVTLSYRQNTTTSDIFSAYNYFAATPAPTGSVTISSINLTTKTISGSFYFDGYLMNSATPVKNITNGVFNNITYITQ